MRLVTNISVQRTAKLVSSTFLRASRSHRRRKDMAASSSVEKLGSHLSVEDADLKHDVVHESGKQMLY